MKILIFGATGMVGQGVVRECLSDPGVELVETIGRSTPGAIQPLHGVRSRAFPDSIPTTEQIGRAMLAAARSGAPKRILESEDINGLAHY